MGDDITEAPAAAPVVVPVTIVTPPAAPVEETRAPEVIAEAVAEARDDDDRWRQLFDRLDALDGRIASLEVAAIIEELEEEEKEPVEEEPQRPASEDEEPKNDHGFYKKWGED